MRVLYVASDVELSTAHGGAVHVREAASGLARLGHAVRAVVKRSAGEGRLGTESGFEVRRTLHHVPVRALRLLALPAVLSEVRRFRPDVVVERYYNFGGEGVIAAGRHGLPAVLEVNSPMVEYPRSPK
ncbi:MAG: glycosyltransferase, partial [Candidatus Binatia bacterium]